ncbi:MAG: type II toxin-antitoxin system VapC family toxin [Hormoscilla sp. GM7CHS1pb]|nr:type II toxin-antitoxin system VapC family toxin [Hormoscilla sp. GM7CHS1pb]
MRRIFLDTSYLIAVIDRGSDLHQRAEELSQELGVFAAVTSEMVLTELLNYFCERGSYLRHIAATIATGLPAKPNTEIVPQTPEQFRQALELYQKRMDKGYSLTDCASMLIMEERKIKDVLTHDKHFTQAGFNALLRSP